MTLALAMVHAGCGAGWRSTPLQAGPLPPRQQAQVWVDGRAHRWHALAVTPDSVSGVPFTQAPQCDICRVALPRTAVDSVRLGDPTNGFWKSVALGAAVTLVGGLVICRFERSCALGN